MTTSRDPDRLIHAFIDAGEEQLQDQIYDAVRAEIEQRRQRTFIGPWRTADMIRSLKVGLTAAAVVVIAVVGFNVLPGSPAPGGEPGVTPERSVAEPSVAEPSATPAPSSVPLGILPEGEHLLWNGGTFGDEFIVSIPAPDWHGERASPTQRRGILRKSDNIDAPDGAGLMLFAATTLLASRADVYVYGDPCRWETTKPDAPVTTVDEAVAALSSHAARAASAPVDISVGGYAGKSIILRVADDAVFSDCDQGEFRTMVQAYFSQDSVLSARDPGQIDKLWILDVNGNLVIVAASYYDGTPPGVVDELDAIVETATINS